MKNNNLFFEELHHDKDFLPAGAINSPQDIINACKNITHCFTKIKNVTENVNGALIIKNAKFNGNGNLVFFKDNEPIVEIFPPPPKKSLFP